MAKVKATYIEPKSYFSPDMKKAYDEAMKKKAAKEKAVKPAKK